MAKILDNKLNKAITFNLIIDDFLLNKIYFTIEMILNKSDKQPFFSTALDNVISSPADGVRTL